MAIILTGSTGVATPAVTDASGGNTATINSMTPTADSLQGFRNRIINGDMRIDQRNAGAAVTASNYVVDRWGFFENGSMVFSVQQSTTAPTGFVNSLAVTVSTAASPSAATRSQLYQPIEGFNIADLGWGTASAKTVTLSFWVRSSLTGQFGGSLQNSSQNYSYPFSFTINSANTFEFKTVVVSGPTSGTWNSSNSTGIQLNFDLGAGSDLLGTAGAWASADYRGATGDVKLNGTSGATLYITGVQLEVGSVATPFERRDYGRELAMCQRYYQKVLPAASSVNFASGFCSTTTSSRYVLHMITEMRAAPTALETTGTAADYTVNYVASATACSSVPAFATASKVAINFSADVASGFTAGVGALLRTANASAYLAWSAEL
jgi:hypothetical protein